MNYTWYDVRLSWTPDRKTFTFEHKDTTTDEYTLGFQHTMAEPLTLNYVGLSLAVYSSGNGAQWVGYTFEPEEISFTDMQLQDTAAMEFLSAMGKPYRLEYTTDLVSSSTWHGAGASLTGTGTNMYFFDPQEAAGSSVSKAYRIVSP